MSDMMDFPKTVEEFMEMYKMVDTDEVYSNGTEYVPIYRMKQWFEHQRTSNAHPTHECVEPTHECVEPVGNSEQLNGTCANCKHYTEEHLCVFWSYFGFEPNDCCSRWERKGADDE